tara:strand:+ start:154 stop:615 length:462 start_codon:yes stop_codon:yes gene_type:complete
MPNPKYGIAFPFIDSQEGLYLHLNDLPQDEVRSNLIHLVLSVKGSRYFLPDFGTNLMRYIFEPLDSGTKTSIDLEIREAAKEFIPNLNINKVEVKSAEDVRQEEDLQSPDPSLTDNSFSFVGDKDKEYTLRVRIDYSVGDGVFESKDFVIINL